MANSCRRRKSAAPFKVTYATMFNPPEELHAKFESALEAAKGGLGRTYPMLIGGKERMAEAVFENRSPINTDWLLGLFQKGAAKDIDDAVSAARAAFPSWSRTPWKERISVLRRASELITERVYAMAAAISLEVGKNRMEALGDAQETADLIAYCCDEMERMGGYIERMPNDPIPGTMSKNKHLLRPHGVWAVVSPFNFPMALAGGPAGAALAAGNTVVFKPATDTPWAGWLLTEAFRDAGVPEGAFNFVTGPGSVVGEALITHKGVDGITFTGSYDVGMHIIRTFAGGAWPRPCIAEMGGKNAAIVSRNADLEKAAKGVMRSAFGLQGQKCSACSRVYVESSVFGTFLNALLEETGNIRVGDPTKRENWMGPVINASAYRQFGEFAEELHQGCFWGLHTGGYTLRHDAYAKGYFCAPTVAAAPLSHRLWNVEMFLPIVMVAPVGSLDEAFALANDSVYGLTAGFFGTDPEADLFFDRIEAGVCYANRTMGATTGAWPGHQPFGGWKGSGSTGKNAGGPWYLPQYMREQSQTRVL